MLDSLYDEISKEKWEEQYFEYNIARYLCWYILHIVKSNSPIEVEHTYYKSLKWLDKHNPNYRNNPFLKKRCPEGEDIKIHFLVKWFYRLGRKNITVNLLKIVAFFNK